MNRRSLYPDHEPGNSPPRRNCYALARWAKEAPGESPWVDPNLVGLEQSLYQEDVTERRLANIHPHLKQFDQSNFDTSRSTTENRNQAEETHSEGLCRQFSSLATTSEAPNYDTNGRINKRDNPSRRSSTSKPSGTRRTSITTISSPCSPASVAKYSPYDEEISKKKQGRRGSKPGQRRGPYNTIPREPKILACILGKYLPEHSPDCILLFFSEEYAFRDHMKKKHHLKDVHIQNGIPWRDMYNLYKRAFNLPEILRVEKEFDETVARSNWAIFSGISQRHFNPDERIQKYHSTLQLLKKKASLKRAASDIVGDNQSTTTQTTTNETSHVDQPNAGHQTFTTDENLMNDLSNPSYWNPAAYNPNLTFFPGENQGLGSTFLPQPQPSNIYAANQWSFSNAQNQNNYIPAPATLPEWNYQSQIPTQYDLNYGYNVLSWHAPQEFNPQGNEFVPEDSNNAPNP